jgi:hypothetical protein
LGKREKEKSPSHLFPSERRSAKFPSERRSTKLLASTIYMFGIIYFIVSLIISGVYRGVCLKKGLSFDGGPFNIDVMAVVVIAAVFVTLNVIHFLVTSSFDNH